MSNVKQIEQLTEWDIANVSASHPVVCKMRRIIDAHAAGVAALVAQLEAAERAHEQALNERDAAHLALEASNTLLARTQDGISPKAPARCMHDSAQFEYDVSRHLERAGFVWDALRRKWRVPGVETATWTEYRGREQ